MDAEATRSSFVSPRLRDNMVISIDVMILSILQEELARKRQLPVPPMPRRGPRAIARSEDNVSGESCLWWKLNMSLWCKKMTSGLCFGMWCGEAEEEN